MFSTRSLRERRESPTELQIIRERVNRSSTLTQIGQKSIRNFQAAISGYALVGGSNEDGVKAKISMRINGDVTFTDAS